MKFIYSREYLSRKVAFGQVEKDLECHTRECFLFTGSAEPSQRGCDKKECVRKMASLTNQVAQAEKGDQGGSHGDQTIPPDLSPALHLPLNSRPSRGVLKFALLETPHLQLFWLRTQCTHMPAIRQDLQPRPFGGNVHVSRQVPN
jgi:hypothetical protein